MKRLGWFVMVLVACGAASACAPTPSGSPATYSPQAPAQATGSPARSPESPSPSPSPASVPDTANGISFERPSTWIRWQPNAHNPINPGPLIYLSTDPLLPACATTPDATPNPADAQGMACDWPLAALAPDGVLVTWYTTRILQRIPSAGEAIQVNGATTRLATTKPGGCAVINADESIDLLVPIGQPTPLSNVAVFACLRGPDLAAAEAQVRAMLASATVRQ